jgi:hypothetical protein
VIAFLKQSASTIFGAFSAPGSAGGVAPGATMITGVETTPGRSPGLLAPLWGDA